jgi:hypothetical protein
MARHDALTALKSLDPQSQSYQAPFSTYSLQNPKIASHYVSKQGKANFCLNVMPLEFGFESMSRKPQFYLELFFL